MLFCILLANIISLSVFRMQTTTSDIIAELCKHRQWGTDDEEESEFVLVMNAFVCCKFCLLF